MPRPAQRREGQPVRVRGHDIGFSYWPLYKGSRRYGLQSSLLATDPWALIGATIDDRCPPGASAEGIACLRQAEQFFRSGVQAHFPAGKPLLLYYAFLNLAKAYSLTVGQRASFDQARHGLSEKLGGSGRELIDAHLRAHPSSPTGDPNVFDELLTSLRGEGLAGPTDFEVPKLLPQLVAGHRLWRDAARRRERFIPLAEIDITEAKSRKEIWLRLFVYAHDLSRYGITHKAFLHESGLEPSWQEVTPDEDSDDGSRRLCFEQVATHTYTHRSSDSIPQLIGTIKNHLWTIVSAVPPYRKYYAYLAPAAERDHVLPQLASAYAVTFYLGSIARYRPQQFDAILGGKFGNLVLEILTTQPNQFLYLLASEFAQREVTRPAIV